MTTAVRRNPAGNLPAELTSFVGRRRELAEAKELLSTSRLVTLTGMGGVGKTRLARRIAADHRRAFPDGVWQVELADLHEPGLLAQAVASALGLRGRPGGWAVATLSEHFADRRLLLLLDNCEHLLDACAVMADALLTTCPSLHVLATSRQPLGVAGERTLPVQPLPLPDPDFPPPPAGLSRYDGIALFLDRARAEVPGFEVTEGNSEAVAQLCHRLDGVPLALELAAIRLRALSPEQVLARLDDRYALLSRGSRSAPARQQTLRGLVDWSYELCSPEQHRLWGYVSVFSGGFDLQAAEAVCHGTPLEEHRVMDLVADLVDKSLLIREDRGGGVRYRMLELLREYGLDRLRAAGEETEARRRHRRWLTDLARRAHDGWFGEEQLEWYQRVQHESSNLRVALDLDAPSPGDVELVVESLVLFADYYVAFGTVAEAAHWIERALVHCTDPTPTRARGLRVAAYVAALQGDEGAATALIEEAAGLAERLGLDSELAWCATVSALLALNRGDLIASQELYRRGYEGFLAVGDDYGIAFTLGCRAVIAALLGDGEQAAVLYGAFEAVVAPGERWLRSYVRWAMGMERWQAGDVEGAAAHQLECVELRRPLRDHLGIGLCLQVLAWVAWRRGSLRVAARLLGCSARSLELGGSSIDRVGFLAVEHDKCTAALMSALGEAAFEAERAAGAELDVGEAVALLAGAPARAAEPPSRPPQTPSSPLTRREEDIAQLIAEGLSNKEIAATLVIAQRTAEGHVEHILTKLGFRSRAQVAAWVAERSSTRDTAT